MTSSVHRIGHESERRKAKGGERLREKRCRVGGLIVALSEERPHTILGSRRDG
ncbi:hypothetical protein J2S90_002625 [Arthrobacter bambusae]|uniref:Uncharacterized protein n=1 Tax=Arthrobacter bambusae TaxID=1338426 RepID=A0AAW8DJR2_9MICC|nr:hypothetical protein [Arthrobacter bambusae]MDQ0127264.1 hypothetical protein [Arthrobacter bambusae]MDQ0178606.1 hypothetical protein [Arthrobacter bambusae]